MCRIYWKSPWEHPRVHGRRFIPKRPVIWHGTIWMEFREGDEVIRDTREWKASSPILRHEAQEIIHEMLNQIIITNGNKALGAGFELISP